MKPDKSNVIASLVFLALVAYAGWLLWLDRLRPVFLMVAFLVAAFVLPVGFRYLIPRKAWSIAAGVLLTPCVLAFIVYLASTGEESEWFPLIAAWVIVVTLPVFAGMSILSALRLRRPATPRPAESGNVR